MKIIATVIDWFFDTFEELYLDPKQFLHFNSNGVLLLPIENEVSRSLIHEAPPVITHPTYDQLHSACEEIAGAIKDQEIIIDVIVGVARGGLLPAVILSHQLDIPMAAVNYSSKAGNGDNKNHINDIAEIYGLSILIVDDIYDSGRTITELAAEYSDRSHTVYTAVLYYKENLEFPIPTFFWHPLKQDSDWIIFPFEKTS